ncbi:TPA: DUF4238 domain-containing protein [Vibrio parahaemolyticus]|nr:DUF4238 domain-containing protein [Vibrio parahaemolyticus]
MNNKKQQHYVWKHYLTPWLTDDKLWCYREGKVFFGSRDNIAQQRFFYEVEPLNDFENTIVKGFIEKRHPSTHLASYSTLNLFQFASNGDEYQRRNEIEEYHTRIEHSVIPIMDKLLNGDTSWLKNTDDKVKFSRFLGVQYSRTNKGLQNLSKAFELLENQFPKYKGLYDSTKISKVFSLLMGDFIGNWVYSSGQFALLENSTELNFVTSDQPVYNLGASGVVGDDEITSMELYYPLSPELALFITNEPQKDKILSVEEADKYNKFVLSKSHEQVYARSKDTLTYYGLGEKVC